MVVTTLIRCMLGELSSRSSIENWPCEAVTILPRLLSHALANCSAVFLALRLASCTIWGLMSLRPRYSYFT